MAKQETNNAGNNSANSFTYLKDVLKGRTAGPYEYDEDAPGVYDVSVKGEALLIAEATSRGNAAFIALVGTCADELLAVVEAAEEYVGFAHLPSEPVIADSCERLFLALSALQTAIEKHRGGSV